MAGTDDSMTEAQLLFYWMRACERYHFRYLHIFNGMHSQYGFPDLFIAGPGGQACIELKSMSGLLSAQQESWGRMLRRGNANYAVHTPAQWASGESERLLSSLAEDADVIDLATRRRAPSRLQDAA